VKVALDNTRTSKYARVFMSMAVFQ
jgi:hypothetical protein